jgi:hypothetical protein
VAVYGRRYTCIKHAASKLGRDLQNDTSQIIRDPYFFISSIRGMTPQVFNATYILGNHDIQAKICASSMHVTIHIVNLNLSPVHRDAVCKCRCKRSSICNSLVACSWSKQSKPFGHGALADGCHPFSEAFERLSLQLHLRLLECVVIRALHQSARSKAQTGKIGSSTGCHKNRWWVRHLCGQLMQPCGQRQLCSFSTGHGSASWRMMMQVAQTT